jgi:hypothetical protein
MFTAAYVRFFKQILDGYSRIDRARGHKYAHVIVDKLGPSVIAPLQHKPIQCFDLEGQYSENRFPGGAA